MTCKLVLAILIICCICISPLQATHPNEKESATQTADSITNNNNNQPKSSHSGSGSGESDQLIKSAEPTSSKLQGQGPVSWLSSMLENENSGRFLSGFFSSTSMILVSEIGDKTFFIAAIMAMRHPRWEVFGSAIAALALMTILSAAMGFTLPHILSPKLTHYASSILFLFFGLRLLYDAYGMPPDVANLEELEEVESELEKGQLSGEDSISLTLRGEKDLNESDPDPQRKNQTKLSALTRKCFSPVFIQCFIMTFLAEWGDRSQIATIALAAAKDPIGVTLGGICGHSMCTGVAVLGGKLLATRISERSIAFTGGVLFLLFAIHSIFFDEF